jgi:hypothetical protein
MFGHTGLGMLICRNEYFIRTHIYALPSILAHGSLELSAIALSLSTATLGNQIAEWDVTRPSGTNAVSDGHDQLVLCRFVERVQQATTRTSRRSDPERTISRLFDGAGAPQYNTPAVGRHDAQGGAAVGRIPLGGGRVNTEDPGEEASSGDRLFLPRLVATGSIVLATATVRTCTRSLKLCAEHSGSLVRLTADYTSGSSSAPSSRQVFRDELLGLMRELADVSWHESRRAIDALDLRTRSGCTTSGQPPTRPYRVKP